MKMAVTAFGPFMTNEPDDDEPVRSPLQMEKLYPALAVAETGTVCPLLYQLTPEGLTVPVPVGLTEVVRLYWVLKLAV